MSKEFWLFSALVVLMLGALVSLKADNFKKDTELDKLVETLASPYDLSKTIKAIIQLESYNGKYLVNLQDPACGVTHININTYMKRHNLKNTNFNRNKACADLINSPDWAILNAIEELEFWKKIHCHNGACSFSQYRNMVKSYNAGWNYKSKKAQEYWEKFKRAFNSVK